MNFLEICQRLRVEADLTSSASTSPTTVVSQTGELARIVNWAASAYTDLQTSKRDWRWLRSTFSFPTVSGTDTYAYNATDLVDGGTAAAITRFRHWWPQDEEGDDNLKSYLTSSGVAGEQYLIFLPWARFRDIYKKGTQTNNPPVHFTIDPTNRIVLGPKPDAVYTISGEYQKSAQILAANADTPEMPSDYHMLIVWNALMQYGGFSAASEVYARAQTNAAPLRTALVNDQLPDAHF